MKKIFSNPTIDIMNFNVENVITGSAPAPVPGKTAYEQALEDAQTSGATVTALFDVTAY